MLVMTVKADVSLIEDVSLAIDIVELAERAVAVLAASGSRSDLHVETRTRSS